MLWEQINDFFSFWKKKRYKQKHNNIIILANTRAELPVGESFKVDFQVRAIALCIQGK